MSAISETVREMMASVEPLTWLTSRSTYASEGANPDTCDFAFATRRRCPWPRPQALTRWAEPRNKDDLVERALPGFARAREGALSDTRRT